ncbi:MAG: hypothetical protein NZ740_01410 [Kiritimatiellae bacterium]|nr:hypothetical protein [Kiritimatiellia bacterium]MDW8457748.1 hypothetical protein [Verrucomicrobiota bacterium]
MSFRDARAVEFEQQLKRVFDRIDSVLEARYGRLYSLHPARPERGSTGNPEMDGLFNIGAAFSPGFASLHGPGYLVEVRMATLDHVPPDVQEQMEREVADMLRRWLPEAFPGRELRVDRDGHSFKIYGDLSLGVL